MNEAGETQAGLGIFDRAFACARLLFEHRRESIEKGESQFRIYLHTFCWLAFLQSAVENWEALRLSDVRIEELTRNKKRMARLRNCRDALLHCKQQYFHGDLGSFLRDADLRWAEDLQKAFGQFCDDQQAVIYADLFQMCATGRNKPHRKKRRVGSGTAISDGSVPPQGGGLGRQ